MLSAQRALNFFRQNRPSPEFFSLPEKLKGGRIEKFVKYWQGVKMDYSEAFQDILRGSRKRPLRATILSSIGLATLYLNRHNPNEEDFKSFITETTLDLTLVPHTQRNAASESWHTSVIRLDNAGLLRRWNLGIFSIMWKADYDSGCGLFKSQCEYLKPGYLDFYDRIVDIGFCDRWWLAQKALREYDIDPKEWNEDGSPKNPDNQLKPMW